MEYAAQIRWRGMFAATASVTAVGVGIGLAIPLLSTILEMRGYSATLIGLNSATAGIASIAIAPLATPLAVRFGVIPVLLTAIAIAAVSLSGFYAAPSFWMWFPLRVLFHGALTVIFILSEFWISASAPAERRGLVLGLYATVLSGGFAIGPWLFSVLGSSGFMPFAAGSLIVAAALAPVIIAAAESPELSGETKRGGIVRYSLIVPTATGAVLLFGAVETGGFALFPVYGAKIGYSVTDTALLISMIGLGNMAMQAPLGLLSDRMRDRRVLLAILGVVGLAGVLVLPIAGQNWTLTALLMFFWGGATGGFYVVGLSHLSAKLSGKDLAAANAAFVFCYSLGMLVGPQVIGIGMDVTGPNGFAWTLAAFFVAYIMFVTARIARRT